MQYQPEGERRKIRSMWLGSCLLAVAVALSAPLLKPAPGSAADRKQQIIERIIHGDFSGTLDAVQKLYEGRELSEQVRGWLEEFQAQKAKRSELDQQDFEKYVGYARARIEREEYRHALSWAVAALDNAPDREAFLKSDWVVDLVNRALEKADEYRKQDEWLKAWQLYTRLGVLFDRDLGYQKLQREAATHIRLDSMFKEGSNWEERVENVRWSDAERALEYIERYYVEPLDFKDIADNGLEHLLLLTESSTAREVFPGLQNEHDRMEFQLRVREHLAQVQQAASLNALQCARHFARVATSINNETLHLPEDLIVAELMRGALEPLDDFTSIIWPRDSEEFDKHTRGDFVGVGISIMKNNADEIEVVSPLEDTPAYHAGIQAGDVISAVDGESIKGLSISKVVDIITGPPGTPVTLTIRRDTEEYQFPLVRERVKIRSVKGLHRDPLHEERWAHWLDQDRGIGYIRITNFQKRTRDDLVNLLSELTAGGLRGLILDLRRNPGGLLDSAWQVTALFLERDDVVVSTKGRTRREENVFRSPGKGPFSDVPVVVLVDDRSASASEIVAGAIRDNGHGIVVGEGTFGKFSVQNLLPLGRSGAKLKLTTSRYYLPKGDSLHRDPDADSWGVTPDIPVRLVQKEKQTIWQMQREADLLGPPKPEAKPATNEDASKEDRADDAGGDAPPTVEPADKSIAPDPGAPGTDEDDLLIPVDEEDDEDEEESKLPPLEQPDENDRPQMDPQLDAALLIMRVILEGDAAPAVAAVGAEVDQTHKTSEEKKAAKP